MAGTKGKANTCTSLKSQGCTRPWVQLFSDMIELIRDLNLPRSKCRSKLDSPSARPSVYTRILLLPVRNSCS